MIKAFFIVWLTTNILAGCTTSRYTHRNDFIPDRRDISSLQEPLPRVEPLSPRGNRSPYTVRGKTYAINFPAVGSQQRGIASWYGMKFHGHDTSNGEKYDVYKFTAAHKNLPLPSYVRVTRQDNGRSVIARVNDRGPFHTGRIIDLSYAAAIRLGIDKQGTAPVIVEVISTPNAHGQRWVQIGAYGQQASAQQAKNSVQAKLANRWPVSVHSRQNLHKVLIGPVSQQGLEPLVARLKQIRQPTLVLHKLPD